MADQKYQTTETGAKINLEKPHNRESDQLYGNETLEDAFVEEIDKEIGNKDPEAQVKKNRRKYIIDVLIILVVFIGFLIYTIQKDGMQNIIALMDNCNGMWLGIAGLFLLGTWAAETISLLLPMRKIYPDFKLWDSFRITMIGQLFNNLTPFASGGQVMQVYVMSKEKKRASETFSVLSLKFIIGQTVLILFTIAIVLSQFDFFQNLFKDWVWLGVIGIAINIGIVISFFLAGTRKNFVLKIAKPFIKLGGKIKIGKKRLVQDPEDKLNKFRGSVEHYSEQFTKMGSQKGTIVAMVLISIVQNICYYAITYAIYKAFGNSGNTFFEIVTTQAFLLLIMSFVPTPGAGLGAEGGFLILFKDIFKNGTINVSILFWRLFIFYLPIICGAIFFIPAYIRIEKQNEKKKAEAAKLQS
jgi:hypothetical protein